MRCEDETGRLRLDLPSSRPRPGENEGNRRVGHEIHPNILRARPFRLYHYTGHEERNLESLQRLYRVRREMLLNMMPVSRPERAGDYAKSWGDPLDEVTQELVARCVGLELATLELGLLDEWAQNMPDWN